MYRNSTSVSVDGQELLLLIIISNGLNLLLHNCGHPLHSCSRTFQNKSNNISNKTWNSYIEGVGNSDNADNGPRPTWHTTSGQRLQYITMHIQYITIHIYRYNTYIDIIHRIIEFKPSRTGTRVQAHFIYSAKTMNTNYKETNITAERTVNLRGKYTNRME